MMLSTAELARALHGRNHGAYVTAPGPGHSRRDDSMTVWPSAVDPYGFTTHSNAGDDWRACRDHVADALGLARDRWRTQRPVDEHEASRRRDVLASHERENRQKVEQRRRRAREMWEEAQHPAGTVVQTYFNHYRRLDLGDDVAGNVLRYHGACPWKEDDGTTVFVLAMIAAMRDPITGEIVGVHRTRLTDTGQKVGRKMYGTAGAIMLDGMEEITTGLAIGEGIESVMAARQMGIRPAWALGSIGAIASFPVLPGVETLTLLGENDANGANARGCAQVGDRWCAAERTVDRLIPRFGSDFNDTLIQGNAACS